MKKCFVEKLYDIDGYNVINFFASEHLKDIRRSNLFFFLMESCFFDKLIDTLLFLIKNNTNKFIV